MRCIYSRNY